MLYLPYCVEKCLADIFVSVEDETLLMRCHVSEKQNENQHICSKGKLTKIATVCFNASWKFTVMIEYTHTYIYLHLLEH